MLRPRYTNNYLSPALFIHQLLQAGGLILKFTLILASFARAAGSSNLEVVWKPLYNLVGVDLTRTSSQNT